MCRYTIFTCFFQQEQGTKCDNNSKGTIAMYDHANDNDDSR